MDFNHLLFSLEGRISRQPYWIGMLIVFLTSLVLSLALAPMFGVSTRELWSSTRSPQAARLDILVNLIVLWPGLAITVKRLHDRGRPSLWGFVLYGLFLLIIIMELMGLSGTPKEPAPIYLLVLVAMVGIGIWLFVELGFFRGMPGKNEYGPDPLAENGENPPPRH